MKNKLLTAGLVILVLGFSLATPVLQANFALVLSSRSAEVAFLTRLTGMFTVGMLFCQIVLLDNYKKLTVVFTSLILALILIHPLLTVYSTKLIYGKLDPFYPFTDMCVLCPVRDQIITLGRFAMWFYVAAVLGVVLKATPWFKENWRKVQALVYVAFFLAVAHMFLIGNDARTSLFVFGYTLLTLIVIIKGVKQLRS